MYICVHHFIFAACSMWSFWYQVTGPHTEGQQDHLPNLWSVISDLWKIMFPYMKKVPNWLLLENMRMLQYNICTVCLYTHSNVSNSLLQVKATIAHQRLKWTPTQQESNEAFKTICFFHWDPQRKTSICNPCGHHPTPNQPHWAAAPHALWHHINRIRVDRVGATVIPGPRMQWYNKSGQRKHVMCAKFTSNVENHWV